MAAQKGKDMLLKLDETGGGSFVTVAGLRATRLSFNLDAVDVTTVESAGNWRELLAGAGLRTASISGSGVFKDAASDASLRQVFFAGATPEFQIIIPDLGTVSGPFQITNLEYSVSHDAEANFEVALVSAGALSFVAWQKMRDDK